MANRFTPINPGSSNEQIISIINKNFAELDAEANTKVYYSSANQVAVNQGQLPGGIGTGTILNDSNGVPSLITSVDSSGISTIKVGRSGVSAVTSDILRIGQVAPNVYGIRTSDGTNDIFFAGVDATGRSVVKVAKAGFDVKTATGSQLIFNSSQNTFKIVSSGTVTIPSFTISNPGAGSYNSNNSTVNVAHGLPAQPAVFAFLSIYNSGTSKQNYYQLPYTSPSGFGSAAVFYNAYFYTDDTNISFGQGALVYGTGTSFAAVTVKYYILQETAI